MLFCSFFFRYVTGLNGQIFREKRFTCSRLFYVLDFYQKNKLHLFFLDFYYLDKLKKVQLNLFPKEFLLQNELIKSLINNIKLTLILTNKVKSMLIIFNL